MVLVVGCGSTQGPPSKPRPEAEAAQQPPMCSMMKDAQLAVVDGEHGVTITFTTQGDPSELRKHVRKMSAMHGQMGSGGMGSGGMGSGGMGSGMMGSGGMGSGMMGSGMMGSGGMGSGGGGEMMGGGMKGGGMHEHMAMVPSHAAVDDVDHGARIVLTPDDPAQLATLRGQVHAHAEMMKSGHCPMMKEHDAPPADPSAHDAHHM